MADMTGLPIERCLPFLPLFFSSLVCAVIDVSDAKKSSALQIYSFPEYLIRFICDSFSFFLISLVSRSVML